MVLLSGKIIQRSRYEGRGPLCGAVRLSGVLGGSGSYANRRGSMRRREALTRVRVAPRPNCVELRIGGAVGWGSVAQRRVGSVEACPPRQGRCYGSRPRRSKKDLRLLACVIAKIRNPLKLSMAG
jgi:hypothetical protein